MAIIFLKDISENDLLLAYVNNVVRFRSNSTASSIAKAKLTILTYNKTLFPDPDGSFYFNFIEWITAIINSDNFVDDLNLDIQNSGYLYDWTGKVFLHAVCTFEITFADTSTETVTRSLKWLSGYLQIEEYKRKNPINVGADNIFVLSPMEDAANNKTYLKYWEGYPFDLALYVPDLSLPIVATNQTNLLSYDFADPFRITRLTFSDGNDNVTIEDVLALTNGTNQLKFGNGMREYFSEVEKVTDRCGGVYLKWINQYGGWSYWLFYFSGRGRSAKDLGEVENDYDNIPDTIGPTVQMGRTSQDVIAITSDTITAQQVNLLEGIFDSPKIYLFTGQPYAKNTFNDWLEVSLKTNSLKPRLAKDELNRFDFQIELPERYTRKL